MNNSFADKLKGGDLRSLGQTNAVVKQVNNQETFDQLFDCLFSDDRIVVMRAGDAVEKITVAHPEYLQPHKETLFKMLETDHHKEFKWHLALIVSRLQMSDAQIGKVWEILTRWALGKKESRIVRVNSIQALFDLLEQYADLKTDFDLTVAELRRENIPSITARLKKLK